MVDTHTLHPEVQVEAPVPGHGAAVTLHLTGDDVCGVVTRLVAGGASLDRGPELNPVGRVAVLRDPFGQRAHRGGEAKPLRTRLRAARIAS